MDACLDLNVYPSCGFLLPLPATEMWKYAVDKGHITDPDAFLESVTERQDIIINLTGMSDEILFRTVTDGLKSLSEKMQLGLDGGTLLRTGGMTKHGKNQNQDVKAHADLTPELNYAAMKGGM